jgi:hypothetical protein
VIWAFATAGICGLLLGLGFRAPSVVAASILIMVGGVIALPLAGLPLWMVLVVPLGAVSALQVGYMLGLVVWYATSRASRPGAEASPRAASEDVDARTPTSEPSAPARR